MTKCRVALACIAIALGYGAAAEAVSPSQVLVLYNADWTDDAPLTDPGQDSKEIAEHYVALHTDPATGEKPYSLGLRCVHRKEHLNGVHLTEDSHDNTSGVVLRGKGKVMGSAGEARDSRGVEFVLPGGAEPWRFDTLTLELRPSRGEAVRVVEGGRASVSGVSVQDHGEWAVRLNARDLAVGPCVVRAECEDREGRRQRWEAEYQDYLDVECSRTGADGLRDDRNYVEDVEGPVKAFLEDPKNALPGGRLLKDHMLFLVVCYGLPKTAAATYGIARGVTDRLADHGADIDLGQRLQLLEYDVEGALGFTPRPHRFDVKGEFTGYFFRAPQAWPLWGGAANPFVHSLAYEKNKGELDHLPEPVAFTPENRANYPGRHLYFSMRVDGATPLEARALIDRAVYASKYGGPLMGRGQGADLKDTPERVGELKRSSAGKWLWGKGYRDIYQGGEGKNRLSFGLLVPREAFWSRTPVYLPGGIGASVISHNGWNNPKAEMLDDLARGVTATAGAARVYRGAPHIHDKSWWDDEILYPFLVRHRTAGECFLMNQVHLEWVTSFVGDPLYRLPERPERDERPPTIEWKRDVRTFVAQGDLWLSIDLTGDAQHPEVAQVRATPRGGVPLLGQTFEGRPYLRLGPRKTAETAPWTIELIDPAGNRAEVLGRVQGRRRRRRSDCRGKGRR